MTEKKDKTSNRLKSLDLGKDKQRQHSLKYTKIIKSLRIILPISAGAIILLLFTWQQIEDANIVPPQEPPAKTPRTIGKNELVNPKFESRDNKGNPYIITAVRALQGQTKEDDLILLEKPFADIALDDGRWIAIKSNQSAYKQTSKYKAQQKEYRNKPEIKAKEKARTSKPEYQARVKAKEKERQSVPGYKESVRKRKREWNQSPEGKTYRKEYYAKPETRARTKMKFNSDLNLYARS